MTAATTNTSSTAPGGARQRPQREDAERQHDELDPARDDHRRATVRRPARGRRRVGVLGTSSPSTIAREYARVPDAPATILFVGDIVGGARPAHAAGAAARRCASATRPTSSSSTARTPPAASGSRRRSPTSCSPPASTSSRSATTPTTAARSTPTSTATSGSCGRRTSCAASPGHGVCVVERDGVRLGVVNLQGNVFLRAGRVGVPRDRRRRSTQLGGKADHVLVDFHAEATSEKVAMGWYLDGRVTAVVGTHTHVPDRRRAACCPAGPPTSPTSA